MLDEKKRKAKNSTLLRKYGITIEEWEEKLDKQKGVCYICKTLPGKGILCVDHIHVKGYGTMLREEKRKYVRGLLCFMCNTALKCLEKTSNGPRNRNMLNGINEYFRVYRLKGE